MSRSHFAIGGVAIVASVFATTLAAGSAPRTPLPPAYVEECGSCHVAYPARFLGRGSWDALLAGLADHFGTDASPAPQSLEAIRAYLESGARAKETVSGGRPLLRISETAWFRHEHPRPGAAVWAHPDVKSPANCGGCHQSAESGLYGERSLRVPKRGESK